MALSDMAPVAVWALESTVMTADRRLQGKARGVRFRCGETAGVFLVMIDNHSDSNGTVYLFNQRECAGLIGGMSATDEVEASREQVTRLT